MGRLPKPTAVKELEGTARADRTNPDEPKPKAGIPPIPSWWVGEDFADCRREWRLTVRNSPAGVITLSDGSMLELYCELRCSIRKTVKRGVQPKGSTVSQVRALAAEFGLLPASRSRIKVTKPPEEDAFMDWLDGNKQN